MGDWLHEQIDLGRSKQMQTYILYILRHNSIDESGAFDFRAFREKVLKYMEDIAWVTLADCEEVRKAQDFQRVETIFWDIAEREAKEGRYYRRANLDPRGRYTASTPPRTLYIAGEMYDLIGERWCWRKSLEKAKAGAAEIIKRDVHQVNEILGIQVISEECVDNIASRIAAAEDFDELETTFEQIAGELWDMIDESAEALFLELEKEAHTSIERPSFDGNIYNYCRDIAEIADDYRRWSSRADERDYAGYDEDEIEDGDVGFYER